MPMYLPMPVQARHEPPPRCKACIHTHARTPTHPRRLVTSPRRLGRGSSRSEKLGREGTAEEQPDAIVLAADQERTDALVIYLSIDRSIVVLAAECMCMYVPSVCVCMWVRIYVNIPTYTLTQTHTHTHIHTQRERERERERVSE